MRLQKFLSAAGICSRRRGEKYISDGLVKVNGETVTELGAKIDPDRDRVEFRGKIVNIAPETVYIALNKPPGYVTSCSHKGERIVIDLVDAGCRVYPVGRLDKDSTGLLILTNDGSLHHRLSHPSFDHEKEYEVTVEKPIHDAALKKMARGVPMMGTKTRPAKVKRLSAQRFRIVLKEGKNRQVRRMVRKVGGRVKTLKRLRVSNVRLGNLPEGSWRNLTETEISGLSKNDPG